MSKDRPQTEPVETPELFAVIELGSSSVRMAVAQSSRHGGFEMLDSLQQTVTLGKDAFTGGVIPQETIESSVGALRDFQAVLSEYGVPADHVRAVATSALREASNREAVLDRLYIATGLDVDIMDEAEVNRFTYQAVHPALEARPRLTERPVLVMEVGGGSTEYLLLKKGEVLSSGTLRLGALRLRAALNEPRYPVGQAREALLTYIRNDLEALKYVIHQYSGMQLLAIGGDIRHAAACLHARHGQNRLASLSIKSLSTLTARILDLSVEETVRQYHMSFPDAETLGPALLAYVEMARIMRLKTLLAGSTNMRVGVLTDMACRDPWTDAFKGQIIRAAINVAEKYDYDAGHAALTADLCQQLFGALQEEHRLDARYELLLTVAAILHDIGSFVSNRRHHKHSMYLILNSEIFGLSANDLLLVALIARYHRRAMPKPEHELYRSLDRASRVMVSKLAALLRVADALSRRRLKGRREIRVGMRRGQVVIRVAASVDLALEQLALREKGDMFEVVYGKELVLERG